MRAGNLQAQADRGCATKICVNEATNLTMLKAVSWGEVNLLMYGQVWLVGVHYFRAVTVAPFDELG